MTQPPFSQDPKQQERLARGRKIALLRQTAAAGLVTGTFATFGTLSQFNASASAGNAAPLSSPDRVSWPVRPLAEPGQISPVKGIEHISEDPVLIEGRANAVHRVQTASVQTLENAEPQRAKPPAPAAVVVNETIVFEDFIDHLLLREGFENEVYADTLGVLTVGVGHRVLPEDNLRLGQKISNERVRELLYKDARSAFDAAKRQAAELGVQDPDFLVALASVNFQLGNGWNKQHRNTWRLMTEGRFREAADEAANSRWNKQTPVRVRDFQNALRALQPAPALSHAGGDMRTQFGMQADTSEPAQGVYNIRTVSITNRPTNGAATLVLDT